MLATLTQLDVSTRAAAYSKLLALSPARVREADMETQSGVRAASETDDAGRGYELHRGNHVDRPHCRFGTARFRDRAIVGCRRRGCLILAFYVGLDSGWWGNGTGDGWEYAMLGVAIFAAAITGAAVAAGRLRRG